MVEPVETSVMIDWVESSTLEFVFGVLSGKCCDCDRVDRMDEGGAGLAARDRVCLFICLLAHVGSGKPTCHSLHPPLRGCNGPKHRLIVNYFCGLALDAPEINPESEIRLSPCRPECLSMGVSIPRCTML
jgi:hypothetical protein